MGKRQQGGKSRIVVSAVGTVGLMMTVSCVQNLSMQKAVQLERLDVELASLKVEQEELLVAVRVLSAEERFQQLAMERGWEREWSAQTLYPVRSAGAVEPGLLAGAWRNAKDAILDLVSTDAAYASER